MRSLLALLLVAVIPDAGAPRDGGVGLRSDGGADAGRDGGIADAGVADAGVPDAGPRAGTWKAFDGLTFFDDAGTSDLVTVPVGVGVEVRFPRPTISLVCDDVGVVKVEGFVDSFRITGLKPGLTHCGFWYERRMWPSRYVEVTVVP